MRKTNLKNLKRDVKFKNLLLSRQNELIDIINNKCKFINDDSFKIDGSLKKKYSELKEYLSNLDRKEKITFEGLTYYVNYFSAYLSPYKHGDNEFILKSRICISGGEVDRNNVSKYCNYEDIHIYAGATNNPQRNTQKSELISYSETKKALDKRNKAIENLEAIDSPYLSWFIQK